MSKERGNFVGGVSLAHPEEAKAVVAKGIKIDTQLWLKAATLERDDVNKSIVLRKA